MSQQEKEQFLARPRVAVLAIDHPGHPPLAVPIWCAYRAGGLVEIVTRPDSVKARLLRAAGGATVVVDEVEPAPKYVSVECELVEEQPPSLEHVRAMATRFLPAEAVEGFVAQMEPEGLFRLRPVTWRAADLSG